MFTSNSDIIAQLRKEILPLQGYKPMPGNEVLFPGLENIEKAFPNGKFAMGAIHEFMCEKDENIAASTGFIFGLLSTMMHNGKISVWISSDQYIFPPAIKQFDIFPDQIIFIRVQQQKEALWIMEEALKCEGLAAVIGDISTLDFTASRRLQLAVEKSRVTGMLIRNQMKSFNSSAALARWNITSLPSLSPDGLPGVGHPRWKVDLLKVRNGKPGSWNIGWKSGRFHEVLADVATYQETYNLKVG